jgi:autotransporter strand-loop-strand O-heptosyltransferase
MNYIHHSEFFIGLSSGLSWFQTGINKHVVMISNFTEEDHEFTTNCTRIVNKSVCNSCWNNLMLSLIKVTGTGALNTKIHQDILNVIIQ